MKGRVWALGGAGVVLLGSVVFGMVHVARKPHDVMKLTSPAFQHNQLIPAKYTCDGDNVNPPLHLSNVPADTKSLALIVDDLDAPMGTWTHWTWWNASPHTTEIAEHSVPPGAVQGATSFGTPGYGGPCPPSGTHRYHFRLYALNDIISLPATATVDQLNEAIAGHIIEHVDLVGLYQRS